MMYVKMDQSGDDMWKLEPVIDLIKEGAVGVIPTDTVYVQFDDFSLDIIYRRPNVSTVFNNGHRIV